MSDGKGGERRARAVPALPGRQRGFTLVEVLLVVIVLGVVMALAIPNYLNFRNRAREAEARSNLGAIRNSFLAYKAEHDTFDVGSVGTMVYTSGDNQGVPFGSSASARGSKLLWPDASRFSIIGFTTNISVFFNYSMETGTGQGDAASFTAMASADLDRNGLISHYYLNDQGTTLLHVGDRF
jgi:prepilin-type N-terminal cleavage/methylation domain-containing protein